MIKAKKKFGQNFLKDEKIKDKIIESMPNSSNKIVEIGPGLGDLTERLLKKRTVSAIEIDSDLYKTLKIRFFKELKEGKLVIINDNVLNIWGSSSLIEEPYDLIANLPYYVATNIILKALQDTNCKNIIVMIQKEVAKKFTANVGDKEFSALSVLATFQGKSKYLFDVSATAFNPVPKVTSAVIYIEKNETLYNEKFAEFLKIAFASPRKKLFKNLSLEYQKESLLMAFEKLSIKNDIRAHQISTDLFFRLFTIIIGE
jgi:16S rRNA (adenine1518-N6/adenine1519-N6)-dimethyltransferase